VDFAAAIHDVLRCKHKIEVSAYTRSSSIRLR
jgi:hypothetical protein